MSIDEQIREWCDAIEGPITAPIEAEKFVAHVRETAPDELAMWLDEHAVVIIRWRMGDYLKPHQARQRAMAKRSAFADQAERFEGGDKDAFGELDVTYRLDEGYKPLRSLTKEDLSAVINDFDDRAKANALEAAYLRAIRRRIKPGQVVGDVFSNDQLSALRKAS